eukprot:TRINITY_DN1595_c0_g1_i10.p1 TRINITY_DN1595_c0_g1~~TRINITY_DN1595_c0_g1_i10.p1  ORF type:complete len:164 (-),score=22.35 TRINITY_DN1595_c0_g1_i10:116-607(-)
MCIRDRGKTQLETYTYKYVANTTFDPERSDRQWLYQTCTQVGWFQTAYRDPKMATRSHRVDLTYYKGLCQAAFGANIWPDIENTNNQFGATLLRATNLIMTNGIEDPWQWASEKQSHGSMIAMVIRCEGCAHCIDIVNPKPDDSIRLVFARLRIVHNFMRWFK